MLTREQWLGELLAVVANDRFYALATPIEAATSSMQRLEVGFVFLGGEDLSVSLALFTSARAASAHDSAYAAVVNPPLDYLVSSFGDSQPVLLDARADSVAAGIQTNLGQLAALRRRVTN